MDSAAACARSVKGCIVWLTSPEILAEFIAIAIATMIAVAGTHAVRQWHKRHPPGADSTSFTARFIEAGVQILPFFFALIVLSIVRWTLGMADMHTAVVNIALQLTIALIFVRTGVYLLRVSLGGESWIRGWETRLTFLIWLFVSF